MNAIVPVAIDGVTAAVNVTAEPLVEGFVEDAMVTLVLDLLIVCVSGDEVFPL
jgi:hypothetical protein